VQLDIYEEHLRPLNPTVLVGLDARGFIIAPALALRLNIRFVPVRKKGKLPGEVVQAKYVKEYGADIFEMQRGVLKSTDRVVVIDDLIATGTCFPFPVPDGTTFWIWVFVLIDVNLFRWLGESGGGIG
jgi:adenine phosphoribosyltransferase